MKRKKLYWRSFFLGLVIGTNLILLFLGFCKVYENTQFLASGEYISAIELNNNSLRILDMYINF